MQILIILTIFLVIQNKWNKQHIHINIFIQPKTNLMSVPVKQAFKLISQNANNPKFKIIDVRTQSERNAIHIPNSYNITLSEISDVQKNLNKFSQDQTYLVYCRSGARSNRAVNWLNSRGFKAINMEGGINEWVKQNGESVKAAQNEGSTDKNEKGCEIY